MGLFNFLKSKKQKTFETEFGVFKTIDTKGLWLKEDEQKNILYYVNGNSEMPDLNEVAFLIQVEEQVKPLNTEINARLIVLFKEINLPILFTDWKGRFRVYSYQVYKLDKDNAHWGFTLINDNPNDDDGLIDFEFEVENGKIINVDYNA